MSNEIDLNKLATESKVVAAGRPAKQPDGALNPHNYIIKEIA